jgi:hypothetical protein
MSTEKEYFQHEEVTVTSTRFIVGAQTFAMRNITSVESVEVEPNSKPPGYLLLLGVLVAVVGFANSSIWAGIVGLGLVGVGAYWSWKQRPTFAVVLTSAGGEVTAYQSESRNLISAIVAALNVSIVERG